MTGDVGDRAPSRVAAATFRLKASLLQLRRAALDISTGIRRYPAGDQAAFPCVLAESRTPLWSEENLAERALQLGKVQNLRCALRRLHNMQLPAEACFSFWKQIGQATERRGYAPGRLLREGCLIPATGGGLCQLSNALYEVALQADLEIVERCGHSRIVPGAAAAIGRDATVAWNYIDLRFRSRQAVLIEAFLTDDELVVRLRAADQVLPSPAPRRVEPAGRLDDRPHLEPDAHSCATCGVTRCFRHDPQPAKRFADFGRTAYLMDERWPEFERYVAAQRTKNDVLGIPLDGARWRQPRYTWSTSGYARVVTATTQTVARSITTRRLGQYGAARLQAQIEGAAAVARCLARALGPDVTYLCVAQSLLPFLWRDGTLGGRGYEVLMTRLPLQTLHERLDVALAMHPERATLGEFRAPRWMVEAEAEALAAAQRIITPHLEIAALFPAQAHLLGWQCAARGSLDRSTPRGRTIAFPGPTAARKGAYEVRAVARVLELEIVLLGSELEGADFWQGVRTRRGGAHWLSEVAAVVQPALIEEKPRVLLAALAAGVPVVATASCGLAAHPALTLVPHGDEMALQEAVARCLQH
ncbi:MAG TPA: VanW family protein [Abditibacteriaceae bacterium]|nr:VanW family protein [Abditibacteriaceae bacterium]